MSETSIPREIISDEDVSKPTPHRYDRSIALLIDAPPKPKFAGLFDEPCPHLAKYSAVRKFLKMFTDFEVHDVSIPTTSEARHILGALSSVIKTLRLKEGDLVLVYFFGNAGLKGCPWSWRLKGNDNSWANGMDILKMISQTPADCLFLLDCFIPTNWPIKISQPNGDVAEIISSRGISVKDPDGDLVSADKRGYFTYCMIKALHKWIDEAKTTYKNHKAVRTLPQAMKDDVHIANHPDRIVCAFSGAPKLGYVTINPDDIRQTGRIRFFHPLKVAKKTKTDATFTPAAITPVIAAPTISTAAAIQAPTSARPWNFPLPAGRKRIASVASVADSGFNEESVSDRSSSLFIADKRRRILGIGDPLTVANLGFLP